MHQASSLRRTAAPAASAFDKLSKLGGVAGFSKLNNVNLRRVLTALSPNLGGESEGQQLWSFIVRDDEWPTALRSMQSAHVERLRPT